MLILLGQFLIGIAGAEKYSCEPLGTTSALYFPEKGAENVPLDTIIRLNFGINMSDSFEEMELPKEEDFQLFQMSEHSYNIEVEIERNLIIDEYIILEIEPINGFEPNQHYLLKNEYWGEEVYFSTGEEFAKEVESIAEFELEMRFYRSRFCGDSTELKITLEDAAEDLLVFYSVTGEEISSEALFMQLDPSAIEFDLPLSTNPEEICIVGAYMNAAGEIGEYSEIVCAKRPFMSCSSVSSINLSWLVLGLSFITLLRRKEEGEMKTMN